MEYNKPLGYTLTRKVKDPAYGNSGAGCIDFFVPEFDEQFMTDFIAKNPSINQFAIEHMRVTNCIVLDHGDDICIPSGVHARLEPNTALTAFNKSGVATKMRLVRGAEYVDSDYHGEIHLHLVCQNSVEHCTSDNDGDNDGEYDNVFSFHDFPLIIVVFIRR